MVNALREIGYMLQAAIIAGWFGGLLFLFCIYVLAKNGVILW